MPAISRPVPRPPAPSPLQVAQEITTRLRQSISLEAIRNQVAWLLDAGVIHMVAAYNACGSVVLSVLFFVLFIVVAVYQGRKRIRSRVSGRCSFLFTQ